MSSLLGLFLTFFAQDCGSCSADPEALSAAGKDWHLPSQLCLGTGAIRIVRPGMISRGQVLRLYIWNTLKLHLLFCQSRTSPAWRLSSTAYRQRKGG